MENLLNRLSGDEFIFQTFSINTNGLIFFEKCNTFNAFLQMVN